MNKSRVVGVVCLTVGIVTKFVFYDKDAELLSSYNFITGLLVGAGIALTLLGGRSRK